MQIDPKHLIQLTEILDCQSFTLAAERLNTSQPALSRMATALEAQLGAQIFASRRNPVTPTALGTELAITAVPSGLRRIRYLNSRAG